jgi:hypothetical protein
VYEREKMGERMGERETMRERERTITYSKEFKGCWVCFKSSDPIE